MRRLGRDLRTLSEDFARSSERMRVMKEANKVNFQHIDYEEFQNFLSELFFDGITREKIVVLFFFCSDIVARAYKNEMLSKLRKLFNWFLDYIIQHVCDWVRSHGGWVSFHFRTTKISFSNISSFISRLKTGSCPHTIRSSVHKISFLLRRNSRTYCHSL